MTLLHKTEDAERRILVRVGTWVVLLALIASTLYFVVQSMGRERRDVISMAIEAPYVGQGVDIGTPIILHGVTVGQVTSISSRAEGGVRLQVDLQQGPTRGLTDAMDIDYRPSNYFGVTGINVIPASSGQPLHSGMQINITPKGNFSLQALLYRLGELSGGVLNQRTISVIERATRYADGLNPLLETVLIAGASVADVQTVSTERLLRNATGVSVAFPGFSDALIGAGNDFVYSYWGTFDFEKWKKSWKYYPVMDEARMRHIDESARLNRENPMNDKAYDLRFVPMFDSARTDLFSRLGYLEGSHINELMPVLESVRTLADTVPKIVSPDSFAYTLTEIRSRLERMYEGSGDQRALQVRIVLDRLPGVAQPLGQVMGGTP